MQGSRSKDLPLGGEVFCDDKSRIKCQLYSKVRKSIVYFSENVTGDVSIQLCSVNKHFD